MVPTTLVMVILIVLQLYSSETNKMLECCNFQHSYCEHCSTNGANNISSCNTNCSAAGYGSDTNNILESRLELDSHTNMPVVGGSVYIVAHTGKTAEFSEYNPDYRSKQIPIVDAAV